MKGELISHFDGNWNPWKGTMEDEQVKELSGGQEPCLALLRYKALTSTSAEDGIEAKLPTAPKNQHRVVLLLAPSGG